MSSKHEQAEKSGVRQGPSFIYELLATFVGLALVYGMITLVGNDKPHGALMKSAAVSTVDNSHAPAAAAPAAATTGGAGAARDNLRAHAKGSLKAFLVHATPQSLPAFTYVDEAGKQYALSDLRGKTVLLNLWATWCGPCRHEMPALDELKHKMAGKPFEVLTISIDKGGLKKPRRFFKKIGVKHLTLYGDGGARLQSKLRAFAMPTTLLIDADGREIGRLAGAAEWASKDALALIEAAMRGRS